MYVSTRLCIWSHSHAVCMEIDLCSVTVSIRKEVERADERYGEEGDNVRI